MCRPATRVRSKVRDFLHEFDDIDRADVKRPPSRKKDPTSSAAAGLSAAPRVPKSESELMMMLAIEMDE